MTKQKVMEWGMNRPLEISLDDKCWSVLWDMANMEGGARRASQGIPAILHQVLCRPELEAIQDHSVYGKLLFTGWKETLEGKA